ncbi:MAG: type II toxin-antitoxin system HicA family toxin [Dehalococcoidia bacterium]|nr:type II toxin-antitoxin system HicA family toxin [Dehalococcoidia bacterium]
MAKYDRLLLRILRGASDTSISFDDLCQLLKHMGFEERTRGSHHIFRKQGIEERINPQRDGRNAKSYQVRQVSNILSKYSLGETE